MQHEEIRQAVRRFAQEQLAPNAARWDREKHFPREALKGLAAMGLYGVAIAEEWDGAGLDYTSLAVACEEIAAGDCSTATTRTYTAPLTPNPGAAPNTVFFHASVTKTGPAPATPACTLYEGTVVVG